MAIIDPEGLFSGERLAACSDLAQLYWPRFFLAANGLARIELSYKSLVSRVFGNFQKIPTSSEIWGIFREYEANFLAVLYESPDGSWWCQFSTSEKFLPKYKKTRDEMSPAPSFQQMEAHRAGYLLWKKSKSFQNESFRKLPETFSSEGVGIGVGIGIGEKQKPPAKDRPSPWMLPDWIDREAWAGFEEMRRRVKAPMTDRARNGIIKELAKHCAPGDNGASILDQSTRNGWKDVYALKQNSNGHASKQSPLAGMKFANGDPE